MFMQSREAVRVKVKKYDGKLPPELQKFSVDPQITSLEVLQSILAKAFNLKGDFSLSYKSIDDVGQEDYLALFSDWDLDAAFLRAQNASALHGSEPCVHLRVDIRPSLECSGEVETESPISTSRRWPPRQSSESSTSSSHQHNQDNNTEQRQIQTGFQGIFMNQMEKTLSIVSRALNLSDDPNIPMRQPLSDAEFRSFLDPVGQVIQGSKLREVIYCGGIDPSLRRVVWKHILNVYPDGMSGKQRMDYMKKKSSEYFMLRDVWRDCIQRGQVSGDLAYVSSMVKKDVLRTDRHHKFYAGSDDNQNIASLFNILTTYALNHPLVSYCQGMSDLASPLLVTMRDEAHAYICLCALMSRLYPNFLLDGEAMTLKFTHLTESLQVYDPQFYAYLKNQQADDLLFCYRWLLLEMKREFAFEDSLRMLEVLWSSLPPCPPFKELALKEKLFCPSFSTEGFDETPISPLMKTPRDNAYTKLCAMRRQNSSISLVASTKTKIKSYKRMNQSLDENIGKKNTSPTALCFSKEFQSLDDAAITTNVYQSLYDTPVLDADTKANQNVISDSSCSLSTASSFEPDYEKSRMTGYENIVDNSTEGMSLSTDNIMSNSARNEIDDIPNSPERIALNNQSKEDLQRIALTEKMSSFDKPNYQNNHFGEKSSIKLIENFNEFKKLSSFNRTNNKDQPAIDLENTVLDTDMDETNVPENKQFSDPLRETEFEDSSPDDSKDYSPMTTSMTRELKLESEKFDRQLCSQCSSKTNPYSSFEADMISEGVEYKCSNFECDIHINSKIKKENSKIHTNNGVKPVSFPENSNTFNKTGGKGSYDVFVWENPLHDTVPGMEDIKANLKTTDQSEKTKNNSNLDVQECNEQISTPQESMDALQTINQPCEEENTRKFKNIDSIKPNSKFFSNMSHELENARRNCEVLLSNKKSSNLHSIAATISNFQKKYDIQAQSSNNMDNYNVPSRSTGVNICEEAGDSSDMKQFPSLLPSPQMFGGGNPFLMFLCLTVLMQHRDHIMRNHMDYNELAMYFDKMVRKHNVNRVLNQARRMYSQYLKLQHDN